MGNEKGPVQPKPRRPKPAHSKKAIRTSRPKQTPLPTALPKKALKLKKDSQPLTIEAYFPLRATGSGSSPTRTILNTAAGFKVLHRCPRKTQAKLSTHTLNVIAPLHSNFPQLPASNVLHTPQNPERVVTLTTEQATILSSAVTGDRSVFFMGPSGSGKTTTLKFIVTALQQKYGSAKVGVTAANGAAASRIKGITLYAFANIGQGHMSWKKLKSRIYSPNNFQTRDRIQRVKYLIIDDISMISAHTFELVDQVFRAIRNQKSHFGGVRLIAAGDFLGLPPVSPEWAEDTKCAFQSHIWPLAFNDHMTLTHTFRQTDSGKLSTAF